MTISRDEIQDLRDSAFDQIEYPDEDMPENIKQALAQAMTALDLLDALFAREGIESVPSNIGYPGEKKRKKK